MHYPLFARIADRLVLKPSTHPIESASSIRHSFAFGNGEIEYWVDRVPASGNGPKTGKLLLIKFPGTGGRAENASVHPADCWAGDTLTWTINPMGYGGSTGPATLQRYPAMIRAIAKLAAREAFDRRIVVTGNSLGGISALAFAANFDVAGVLLRNPPPLHQLIGQRPKYVIPTLGTSKWVAASIPQYLDAVANARQCDCPCWLVTSEKDQLVPIRFQMKIWNRLAGPKQQFPIPGAGHGDPVPTELASGYVAWIQDLGKSIAANS